MIRLSTLLAVGLVGALAWDVLLAPRIFDANAAGAITLAPGYSSIAVPSSRTAADVNRTRKSDRVIGSSPATGIRSSIATVELGPDGTIVLRNSSGDTLFTSNPSAQRSTIAKNVTLPQLTVQTSARHQPVTAEPPTLTDPTPAIRREPPPSATISTERGQETKRRPAGCDPAFSPIAAPQLGHIFGRCITSAEAPTRLALAR